MSRAWRRRLRYVRGLAHEQGHEAIAAEEAHRRAFSAGRKGRRGRNVGKGTR